MLNALDFYTEKPTIVLLLDIDGCIADVTNLLYLISKKLPFEKRKYTEYFKRIREAHKIHEGVLLYKSLNNYLGNYYEKPFYIYFVTGRREQSRTCTIEWLADCFDNEHIHNDMFMRADGDERPAQIIKKEMLEKIKKIHENDDVKYIAIDDDRRVRKMYEEEGVFVLQPFHKTARSE